MTRAKSATRLSLEVTPGASLLIPCKTSRLAVMAASLRLGGGASPRLDGGTASTDMEEDEPRAETGISRTEEGAAVSRAGATASRTDGGATSSTAWAVSRSDGAAVSRRGGGTSRTEVGTGSRSATAAVWSASAALERGATSRLELRLDGGLGSQGELAVMCSRIGCCVRRREEVADVARG